MYPRSPDRRPALARKVLSLKAAGTRRRSIAVARLRPYRPLIFAHRGSSAAEPEHTLGAYLRAIAEGADGLECDVRLTRDGHLVCVHDRRINRTSNGRGLVSRYTLAELNELDFGSWHPAASGAHPTDPPDDPNDDSDVLVDRRPDGPVRVLTLDRLLVAARAAGRPMRLLIETKHPSRYGSAVELKVLEALRRHGLDEPTARSPVRVTIMSFSALAVRRIRRYAPRLPTVMLLEFVPPGLRTGRLPFGATLGGPSMGLVRAHPELVRRLHVRGHQVYVWTVNEPDDLDLVHSLGVEGIITDRPDFARRHLEG